MRRSTIRKGLTQKEMAERFNISVKTVKKYTSEPREQYEQTAADRRRHCRHPALCLRLYEAQEIQGGIHGRTA